MLVLRAWSVAQVMQAVRFARQHHLLTAVRGGGHNIAGSAVCDDGLLIDLSPMRWARVDPTTNVVRVAGGARLADLDRETTPFGLAVPIGINSTTGVAGLTLGGGFGWLTRKFGMTVDSLLAADVVTAEGELVVASAKEHPDLFWALRGGGGNFGIVTSFLFRAHEVGPDVLAGLIVYPHDEAETVLKRYRDFVANAPDELSVWVVLRRAPPLPFLPEDVHGQGILALAVCHIGGDPKKPEKDIAPLSQFGTVLGSHVGMQPFAAWQQAFDPLLTPGARNYWKTHDFDRLDDGLIAKLADFAGKSPSPHCEVFVAQLGGQANRVPPDATAYPHRHHRFTMNVHGRWETQGEDERCIAWARDLFQAAAPFATGVTYVNFMTADETDRVGAAYGSAHARLAQVKARYDPDNFFRLNHNIRPATR